METETTNEENNGEKLKQTKKGQIISKNSKINFIRESKNKEENNISFRYHIINSKNEYNKNAKLEDERNNKIRENKIKEKNINATKTEKNKYKIDKINNRFNINKSNLTNSFNIDNKKMMLNFDRMPKGSQTNFYNNIPKFLSFQRCKIKTSGNFTTYLNIQKSENNIELEEIPKSEYYKYKGKEAVLIGGGLESGEYRFNGEKVFIILKEILENNIKINKEEIMKEINIRKNEYKKKKGENIQLFNDFIL